MILHCDRCGIDFHDHVVHDCTPTRAEFDQLRADLQVVARAVKALYESIGRVAEGKS